MNVNELTPKQRRDLGVCKTREQALRSLNRVREAEEAVIKAQEYLAHVVLEERKAWNLD